MILRRRQIWDSFLERCFWLLCVFFGQGRLVDDQGRRTFGGNHSRDLEFQEAETGAELEAAFIVNVRIVSILGKSNAEQNLERKQ